MFTHIGCTCLGGVADKASEEEDSWSTCGLGTQAKAAERHRREAGIGRAGIRWEAMLAAIQDKSR